MAWSASKIFTSTIEDIIEQTTAIDFNSDTFYVALFDNSITPDQTVASSATALGAGVWASGQVSDGAEWAAGGQALDNVAFTQTGGTALKLDADDEASAGSSATLTNVYGVLIYDFSLATPVDNQGICFLYAGGPNSVTDGSLTVRFHTDGVLTLVF